MKKWTIALITASLAGTLLAGCGDEPRKEAKLEDICAAYKARLDGIYADQSMSDEDRINMIPHLPGYSSCKDSIGTGSLNVGASGQVESSQSAATRADADQRSRSGSQ